MCQKARKTSMELSQKSNRNFAGHFLKISNASTDSLYITDDNMPARGPTYASHHHHHHHPLLLSPPNVAPTKLPLLHSPGVAEAPGDPGFEVDAFETSGFGGKKIAMFTVLGNLTQGQFNKYGGHFLVSTRISWIRSWLMSLVVVASSYE